MKKFSLIVIIIAVLIVGIVLTSCKSNKNILSVEDAEKILCKHFDSTFPIENIPEEILLIKQNSSIKVDSIQQSKKTAIATCTVTALDVYTPLSKLLNELPNNTMTYGNVKEMLLGAFSTAKTQSYNVEISFNYVDGNWVPTIEYEHYNAFYGGYTDYCMEAIAKSQEAEERK